MAPDPDLHRFLDAQQAAGIYDRALAELRQGRKLSHWMWFVFPQLAGLGHSATTRYFAISGVDQARRYLTDPVLGKRLRECAQTLLTVHGRAAEEIFGATDAVKLRSSMTLFHVAAPDERLFADVLDRYFDGEPDDVTLAHATENPMPR